MIDPRTTTGHMTCARRSVHTASTQASTVVSTYRITTRNMTDGLVGIILTGFRDGVVATRMNAATVQPARLAGYLIQMRASLQAKGLLDEDALAAARRPRPIIAFA